MHLTDATDLFQTGRSRYQPTVSPGSAESGFRVDSRALATAIGLIALLLPPVLMLGSKLADTCFHWSLSHFYYAPLLGSIFVGALVFVGIFMIAYRADNRDETRLASIAGVFTILIALIPTSGFGCSALSFRATPVISLQDGADGLSIADGYRLADGFNSFAGVGGLHYFSAFVTFSFLTWMTLFVFTRIIDARDRVDGTPDGDLVAAKLWRNRIYILCGAAMLSGMGALGFSFIYEKATGTPPIDWNANRLTFVFESVVLMAFGISWIVKGRLFDTILKNDARLDNDLPARAG